LFAEKTQALNHGNKRSEAALTSVSRKTKKHITNDEQVVVVNLLSSLAYHDAYAYYISESHPHLKYHGFCLST